MRKFGLLFALGLLVSSLSGSPASATIPTGYAQGDLTGTYPWPQLAPSGVTAGVCVKPTVDGKGRAISCGSTISLATDVTGTLPTSALSSGLVVAHQVRGVVNTNQSLTAFASVAGGTIVDGVTYAAGDRVLLVGQTTKSQNGPWVVGTVAAGVAPLTRPADFASGASVLSGSTFEVSEGTQWANSTWKITTTGGITVDTTNFDAYPRVIFVAGLSMGGGSPTGTVTTAGLPILANATATIRRTTAATPSSTVMYNVTTVTTGAVSAGSITIQAQVAAGTINTADGSTVSALIQNW